MGGRKIIRQIDYLSDSDFGRVLGVSVQLQE